jgi:hypothetical protein
MLASLVVWIGGIVFFAFVVAPTVFAVLPTHHLAGSVVVRSLAALHWMGLISGIVFALTSMVYSRLSAGSAQPLAASHLLIYAMIVLTLVSQFGISGKMIALRNSMPEIDNVPLNDPRRVEFNQLHQWSTGLEGGILLLGLALLSRTAQRFR